MNAKLFITAAGMLLLASCGHDTDLQESASAYKEAVSQENAEKVFGMKFDSNHDWCSTVNGQVKITADASVKKVQLMVDELVVLDESAPSYVSRTSMKMLNQTETKGQTSLTLYYDAPKNNLGLYVAFITDDSYYLRKVENGAASFTSKVKTRGAELTTGYKLPDTNLFHIAGSEPSWASMKKYGGKNFQGWNEGEQFYYLNDYTSLKMTAHEPNNDYTDEIKENFKTFISTYLPNGRKHDNTPGKVFNTDAYNNNCYIETNGEEPVILTPMYKCDHPTQYGYEVYNSDLYYYYYNPANVSGDFVSYIKSLPKYKAIPFSQVFIKDEDEKVGKHGSYGLLYFETGNDLVPATANTPCTFFFPKGYRIGFMVKANTDADKNQKRGELYGDGRLNNNINEWGHFKSSGFTKEANKTNFPRLYWFAYEGMKIMSWESGTDADFNDIMIQVEGGKVIPDIPEPEPEMFTYCFEDTEKGDFDLNDVVIKALRINETTVEYRIVACGAHDKVSVMNLNCGSIKDYAEVHELFNVDPSTYINTDGSDYGYVSATKTVDKDFSLLNAEQQPYIFDITTNVKVYLAKEGENPHGILVPWDFQYPNEKIPVKEAYPEFNTWGTNSILSSDWYKKPIASKVR